MKMLVPAVAAAMLLFGPVGVPSPASAGLPSATLSGALPQIENVSIQKVGERRRGVRYERRMRQERRIRHERRAVRRCIRRGHCTVVYVTVPVYYYVPVWYSHPIYYFY
jgi:hypothetical protein